MLRENFQLNVNKYIQFTGLTKDILCVNFVMNDTWTMMNWSVIFARITITAISVILMVFPISFMGMFSLEFA